MGGARLFWALRKKGGHGLRQVRRQFGENFRELRRSRSLSQDALAGRAGVSVDVVRRIELGTGSPSLDTLARLARGLDVTLHTVFTTYQRGERDLVAELTDHLAKRPPKVTRRILQLARAVLDSD